MKGIRLHSFIGESRVNGPGTRSVFWVQGCERGCDGCFNPETHDARGGDLVSVENLLERIPFGLIDGISISGGEPFLQARGLASLAGAVKNRGKTVLVYTGYRYEELGKYPDSQALLDHTDILVDGPFIKHLPALHPWAGSGNQRVLEIRDGKVSGEIMALEKPGEADMEIHILADGTVLQTGFK